MRFALVYGLLSCVYLLACDEAPPGGDDAGAAGVDAGLTDRDSAVPLDDAGPPPDGVPTLVAIGKFGRITTSCDGGETWAFDRSDDDGASCVGIDCDHHAGSSTGLTWGGGWFYASFGWGAVPMRVMRSRDGVDWELAHETTDINFAGLAWAQDRLVGAQTQPQTSSDRGASFEPAEWPEWDIPEGEWAVGRQVGFAPIDGGRIAVVAGAGDGSWGAVILSRDGGRTFAAATVAEVCRGGSRPPVFGGSTWVLPWAHEGSVCTSRDGGETWTGQTIAAGEELSPVVYTGSEHVLYSGTRAFRSADGTSWDESTSDLDVGALGYDPVAGAFVAVRRLSGYEEQRFYRSTDGASWTELAAGAHTRSHPITHIVFGWGAADGACAP